jgi:hypothetical protein
VDVTVPGLAIGDEEGPTTTEVVDALARADLVIVENLCSLPLNPVAGEVVADVLAGRPALLHHHDLPWQRPQFLAHPPPPDDPCWRHVTINELSRRELARQSIEATTVYNSFVVPVADGGTPGPGSPRGGATDALRWALGSGPDDRLVLQPTRALDRKNVAAGMATAARLGATFWLLGPAEDGYGPELDRLVSETSCPVVLGVPDPVDGAGTGPGGSLTVEDAYRMSDVVALPSTWEGFGNPSVESATHRRPLVIGPYPVAAELAAFGFDWFSLDEVDRLDAWLADPDPGLIEHNLEVARTHFSVDDLPGKIAAVLPVI